MKKLLASILALCMILCTSAVAFADDAMLIQPISDPKISPMAAFKDLESGAWYQNGIEFCLTTGIMKGVTATKFEPFTTVTRAMVVEMLWNIEGKPVVNYALSYKDVPADAWYGNALRWATSEKIVNGFSATEFGPKYEISREQFAAILYNYAKKKGVDINEVTKDTNTLSYEDIFTVNANYSEGMHFCLAAGIVQGKDGYVMPQSKANRAEAAAFIQRFCNKFVDLKVVPVAPVVEPALGGWNQNTTFETPEIPADAKAALDQATAGLLGKTYTPVVYFGSQVVAGINYGFLCVTKAVTPTAQEELCFVKVYKALDGSATIQVYPLKDSLNTDGSPVVYKPVGAGGAWTSENAVASKLPENVQKGFDLATAGLLGVKYTPLAWLGSQVVAGANYAVLCLAQTVTATPGQALTLVVFNVALDGTATIKEVLGFTIQ